MAEKIPVEIAAFQGMDIYLLDQLLRGFIKPDMRILDAGCGYGRNIQYLIKSGYCVCGIDKDPEAIDWLRHQLENDQKEKSTSNFQVAPLESIPYADNSFDYIIANAVLHFAGSEEHFHRMTQEMARVLKSGGIFFSRLMTAVGAGEYFPYPEDCKEYKDGSIYTRDHYFASEERLSVLIGDTFKGKLLDPLKSTVVHGSRTMTTLVVQKD